MDSAELRYDRSSLMSEAQRFFEKSGHPPCCESTILYGCWQFGNEFPMAHPAAFSDFIYLYTAVGDGDMNKFGTCSQWRMAQVRSYN
jgi:hypothetical protein